MVNENRQLLKSLDNSDLSAIEKDKKQFELKLTQLIDNIINLENTLKEQKNKLNQLENELKISEKQISELKISEKQIAVIKILKAEEQLKLENIQLSEKNQNLEKQKREKNNIQFEKNQIIFFKYKKQNLETKHELNLQQIKKIENSVWKRFLIGITCGLYNPIAKLKKQNEKLALEIKSFDDLLEINNEVAKILAEEYMKLEEKIQENDKNISFNQEKLKEWKKQELVDSSVSLHNISNKAKDNSFNAKTVNSNSSSNNNRLVSKSLNTFWGNFDRF